MGVDRKPGPVIAGVDRKPEPVIAGAARKPGPVIARDRSASDHFFLERR